MNYTQKGFSYVELNVCCCVMLLLAAICGPYLNNVKNTHCLSKEMRELYTNFQRAKIEAIKENTYVVFKHDDQGYEIFVDDGKDGGKKGDWKRQKGEKMLINHEFGNGVTVKESTFTAQRTRFTGRVAMKAGRIIIENDWGNQMQLVVNTIGRIRIE